MANCKACKAEIYFLVAQSGKVVPVDADSLDDLEIGDLKAGEKRLFNVKKGHVSHFATCPFANDFRKGKYRK